MYASNVDEDWVYLHETPPTNTVLQGAVNLINDESDSSLSSLSSNSSISSISDRSDSLSSTELENGLNDDISLDSENQQTASSEEPLLIPQDNNPQMISTHETNGDVLNTKFQLNKTPSLTNSSESLSVPNNLRCRTQAKNFCPSEVFQSTPIYQEFNPQKYRTKSDSLISCTCMIVILSLPFLLGSIVTRWDQSMIQKITKELDKTNQRLNDLKNIPTGNIEEKLIQRLEEKFQNMINQQLAWHEHEKSNFILQIRDLHDTLNITQTNLTNTIHQLKDENEQLKEQIQLLENRLGVNSSIQSTTFKKFINSIDTSFNLSGIFKQLTASVSKIVDGNSTSEKIRRSVENISSSFRKAKLSYATWIKSRVKRRIIKKFPWRWTFQRHHHQTLKKTNVCQSKLDYSINKIHSMKNWMVKLFRP